MLLGQEDNRWVWVGIYPKQHGNSARDMFCRKKETQCEVNVCKVARFVAAKSVFLQNIHSSASSSASFPAWLADAL